MDILKQLKKHSGERKNQTAVKSKDMTLNYGELEDYSNRLAMWISKNYKDRSVPVVVYGHKSAAMILCFLACVKSGRAYCPLDSSLPVSRIETILEAVQPKLVLATCDLFIAEEISVGYEKIMEISTCGNAELENFESQGVKGEETFYIIFTSGSTGNPKGVEITRACLENYLDWSVDIATDRKEKEGAVFLNQAPFSFDLSVMDIYTCLAVGGTLITMERSVQEDFTKLLPFFSQGDFNIWVSTPSFAEVCLSDQNFKESLMPKLNLFLFCGEMLSNNTAAKLKERFPKATVVNTYGPTESTVAVTEVTVTNELLRRENPLPVGIPRHGTLIEIWGDDGQVVKEGEKGEIVIIGDTVGKGYFRQPEFTEKVFFDSVCGEKACRGYRTGDIGYLRNDQLYCCGRMDSQVKFHGYRIETGDIENNILRLPRITYASVIPNIKEDKVKSLHAFIVMEGNPENPQEEIRKIKGLLKEKLPIYMIPKKFTFLDKMPVTGNGKADVNCLKELLK